MTVLFPEIAGSDWLVGFVWIMVALLIEKASVAPSALVAVTFSLICLPASASLVR